MLERSILRHGASVATATAAATGSMPTTKVASKPRGSLLGYPLRETAAYEMLYGGVRVRGLVTPAFPLHFLKSEELPGPSLSRERRDLEIEMQLPQSFNVYDNVNLAVQRLVGRQLPAHAGTEEGPTGPPTQKRDKKAFDMGSFYSVHHHAERHHNSSLPYAPGDTNNVLAMRLFPVNVGQRLRVECVRIRTEDCMKRLQAQKLAGAVGRRMQFPLPLATEQVLKKEAERRTKGGLTSTLYSGALNPADWQSLGENQMEKDCASYAHLRGAAFHPPSHELSIFTRPSDQGIGAGSPRGKPAAVADSHWELPQRSGYRSSEWMPLQMIKPIQHNWSPGIRSSGSRGPHMQLRQERLDQKGFGWKKKSRSLWQQDIATAGFRPHRFY